MKDNLIARQLRRLGLAYEIQKVANPILKRGGHLADKHLLQ